MSVPALAYGLSDHGADVHIVGGADPSHRHSDGWGPTVHVHAQRAPRSFRYAPSIGAGLARLDPQLIDVQGLWTYPSLANLRHHRRTGTPYVVTPRGMLDPWARARSYWKKRLVRLWFEDAHLAAAACLRATAEMEAEHFRSFGLRQPIAIVPNGVATPPLVRPARPPGAPHRLLFLSRIHPKKGLAILLRAWRRLQADHPDWELVIAGPDELGHTAEMQRLAATLGAERVSWWGPASGGAKTDLYRSADLFVLPTHAENFGLVVAEALAHGVPVVTTRNAPWQGLERHGCGWWIDLNETALVTALNEAMARPPAELGAMGQRGHAWMERDFAWSSIAEQMLELYLWIRDGATMPAFVNR